MRCIDPCPILAATAIQRLSPTDVRITRTGRVDVPILQAMMLVAVRSRRNKWYAVIGVRATVVLGGVGAGRLVRAIDERRKCRVAAPRFSHRVDGDVGEIRGEFRSGEGC